MTSLLRPLDIFTKGAFKSSCVWLDAYTSHHGERACWAWMWNRAVHRITTEDGAMSMEDRVRINKLRSPTIIVGDMSRFGKQTKLLFSDQQCQLKQATDECRSTLSLCLDQIVRAEPLTGSGIGPPPILVLGGLSGRMDRAMSTIHSLVPDLSTKSSSHSAAAPTFVLDGENLVCVLPKGEHRLALGPRTNLTDVCGLIPICQKETKVTTRGLRWNLENAPLSFGGMISTHNELDNDEVSITTSAPLLFTLELLASITGQDQPPAT
ncbi:hypothetical protein PENTCL1PPCAC_14245 [Pristionchus entomophagus]|uniref:Thiamin pyrophosphokinase thiamin-binding domain-containing protein n=1 Tax=Pristionchus entomophagus TaxID=358040 RepID=A0AAV5TFR9_9BILA|nr:hypothetical protein PENTCL1PPCAC_14245 [Pristionchus entomophagus]